jgi:hypothetical protein
MVDTLLATEPRTPPALYDGFDHILVNGTWRHGRDGRVAMEIVAWLIHISVQHASRAYPF